MLNLKIAKQQQIEVFSDQEKTPEKSADLIFKGSSEDFIKCLVREVLSHEAVNHEYLYKLKNANFKNKKLILRDYAYQYSYYSKGFTIYLKNVVQRLSNKKHKDILMENYYEELGKPNTDKFEDWSHKKMFNAFAEEVGVNTEYKKNTELCFTTKIWKELFDEKCRSNLPGVGLGAIGLATEFIVPHIYSSILVTIKAEKSLSKRCAYFFELHTECDIEHGLEILKCCKEEATSPATREGIRFGAISSLNLRKIFWDVMLARAKNIENLE